MRAMIVKMNMKYNLKRSIPQEIFESFWKLRQIMKGLSLDAQSDLWVSIKCTENIMITFLWSKALTYDNDDDVHEYYYSDDDEYYYYDHHRHHYHHVPSTGYLYVILTLHLNQNHLGTSGQNLMSLRKDDLLDWLMKDFIFINWITKLTEFF